MNCPNPKYTEISIHEAARLQSIGNGQGFAKRVVHEQTCECV